MPAQHPDRFLTCQEAIETAFRQLADLAVCAGWDQSEVAAALVDIADCHMLSVHCNLDTDKLIRTAIESKFL